MPAKPPHPQKVAVAETPAWLRIGPVLAYVAVVLAVDTCAVHHVHWPWNWALLSINPADLLQGLGFDQVARSISKTAFNDFDLFKFTCWFLIPFAISLRTMEWSWLGFQKWKRLDLAMLFTFVVLSAAAVLIIPFFPSLRDAYPSLKTLSQTQKWNIFFDKTLWTLSWLIGWEFLHRYFLLRNASQRWPRFGWILVPLSETIYHLQKPPLEAAGMALFSIIATQWTLRRRNMALPFLVHLAIEISLWIFLLLL